MRSQYLSVALGLVLGLSAPAIELYVAHDGNDAWSGRLPGPNQERTNGPLRTLPRARDVVRELRDQEGFAEPVTVSVRGGIYVLARTLELTAEDSGTRECRVTYRAFPGETVVLAGAKAVRGWRSAGDGLFMASLVGQGFSRLRSHQLFFRGEPQTLARHPNLDSEHPHTGGLLYVDAPSYRDTRTGLHYAPGEIPVERWRDLSQAEVSIFPYNCWDHNIIPVRSLEPALRHIRLRYPVAGRVNEGNRYFVQGVREALDVPGEWHADWETGDLAFRPPGGRLGDGDVTIPAVENLVLLRGTAAAPIRYVTFTGFHFAYAEHDGVVLEGADHCAVTACTFRQLGGVGVNAGFVRNATKGVGNAWRRGPRPRTRIHSGDRSLYRGALCTDCRIVGNDIDSVGGDGDIVHDRSGTGLHGDRNGGAWVRGEFGSAFLCDGTEAMVDVPDEAALELGTSDFTIEGWLYPTSLAIDSPHQRRRILDKGRCPTVWWNVDVLTDGRLRMEMGGGEGQYASTDSQGRIPEHRWTHVVVAVDRSDFSTTYYFNGARDSVRNLPRTFTRSLSTPGKSFTIGAWQPYIGLIDDLRIYRRALSGVEAAGRSAARRERYGGSEFTVVEE